ncbi:1-acyl-sn-glycerol-3-phosphate acyltransferase [Marinobacterium sedimentorum]|uniref:1-acyl-sn-glycerol-3-phosphate acyltransferase n=1 Tax=Marinobacterium sedimentorum TaxID=2927804 RepID=UPI0020C730E3|nr:1-acyl-sn-glycerol-3-phosphate acyltransferase [Marinobacterium sedimentorum]MCP8690286.1 1-acyl-sn-glycerol-3-phosphate acyltransferase [Marinobacterium sedimentorum]
MIWLTSHRHRTTDMKLLELIGRPLLSRIVTATTLGSAHLHGGPRVRYVLENDRWSHVQLLLEQARRAGVDIKTEQIIFARSGGQQVLKQHLSELCRQSLQDPQYKIGLIPVSIFHGRLPIRETSWLNLLYAEAWDQGGRIGRLMQLLINGRQTLIQIDPPLQLQDLTSSAPDTRTLTRKASLLLLQHFRTRRRAVVGPDLSHRRTLMAMILHHPGVQQAIATRARDKRESLHQASRYAAHELQRIAANFSPVTARLLHPLLNATWRRLYDDVEILGLDRLRERALDHQLVYLPCHRSHMDYLLLSWALYRHGLMLPHVAAGDNLDIPLIGPILKRGGAIFMRRSFQNDGLYRALYQQYLALMSRHGHALEYFIEGGRSRTGRLLPARTGLLNMTLDAWCASPERPVALVPVWIGYDRVVEAHSYQHELSGGNSRHPGTFDSLQSAWQVLRQRFGRVSVSIGEPIALADAVNPHLPTRPQANALGRLLLERINQAAVLTETGVLATVMLGQPQLTLDSDSLAMQCDQLRQLAQRLPNAPVSVPREAPAHWIARARARRQLEQAGNQIQLEPAQGREMTFYRNNMMHLFVLPGLCLLLVRRSAKPLPQLITRMLRVLYPYLQAELFLPWPEPDFSAVAAQLRKSLLDQGLLTREGKELHASDSDTALCLMRNAEPVLLRYYLLCRILQRYKALEQDELMEKSLQLAAKLQREFGFDSAEYADKRVLSGFVEQLIDREILQLNGSQIQPRISLDGLMKQARGLLTERRLNFIDQQLDG